MWVPPAGWQDFLDNYHALQQLKVPAQYQRAQQLLLQSGGTFVSQANSQVTVNDDDVYNWLMQAKALASKLHNTTMAQSAQAGMDRPTGWLSDADRFYDDQFGTSLFERMDAPLLDPNYWGGGSGANFEQELERIALWVALGIGALVLGPPLVRMVQGRR